MIDTKHSEIHTVENDKKCRNQVDYFVKKVDQFSSVCPTVVTAAGTLYTNFVNCVVW